MQIITRQQSGLRPATKLIYTTWDKRAEVVYHYTYGPETQSWKSVQDWCMDGKGHSDIDYNCGIDMSDGRLFEGRQGIWLSIGSHNLDRNTRGIGACFIGTAGTPLSEAAKRTARWVYEEATRRKRAAGFNGGLNVRVHSDHQPTSCPGSIVKSWVKAGMPVIGTPNSGGDDMFCAHGETSTRVKLLQRRVQRAGGSLANVGGVDGEYGDGTARELAKLIGGDGRTYDDASVDVLDEILRARTSAAVGGKGDKGDRGESGKTPTQVTITGPIVATVTAVS